MLIIWPNWEQVFFKGRVEESRIYLCVYVGVEYLFVNTFEQEVFSRSNT